MARIEGLRIRNYRALKDVTLGKLWNTQKAKPLTPMTVVVGKNGAGKSVLLDAFGFLADCLKLGVAEACNRGGRGGFNRIRSQGSSDPIAFEIYYRQGKKDRPITYEVEIDVDSDGRHPYVVKEQLRQRRKGQKRGKPLYFLRLVEGMGYVWTGEPQAADRDDNVEEPEWRDYGLQFLQDIASEEQESGKKEFVDLDVERLGIATLGSLKKLPRISAFREFIESWYLSYFTPDAARDLPLAGSQRHLNTHTETILAMSCNSWRVNTPKNSVVYWKELLPKSRGLKK